MIMGQLEYERPTIKVFVHPEFSKKDALNELCFGIEEEGVPYDLSCELAYDAKNLAWEAGQKSRLEVGLGIDPGSIVLTYGKLDKNAPLFEISSRSPEPLLRAIGANAARLVKKLPFKPLSE